MRYRRLRAEERRQVIVETGLRLCDDFNPPYSLLTRRSVASALGISEATISRYFSVSDLRAEIMLTAIKRRNLAVVAQGLNTMDYTALRAPDDIKADALEYWDKFMRKLLL